jgi:hypothetical protein
LSVCRCVEQTQYILEGLFVAVIVVATVVVNNQSFSNEARGEREREREGTPFQSTSNTLQYTQSVLGKINIFYTDSPHPGIIKKKRN